MSVNTHTIRADRPHAPGNNPPVALTDFAIVRRSLSARLFSTCVTAVLIAVSVGLVLVLLTTRRHAQQAFERGPGNMNILVSATPSPMGAVLESVFYSGLPQNKIEFDKWNSLTGHPLVDWAFPVLHGDNVQGFPTLATVREFFVGRPGTAPPAGAEGTPPAGRTGRGARARPPAPPFMPDGEKPFELAEGMFFREGEEGVFDVVLGARAAEGLRLKVGDTLEITHGADDEGHDHGEFEFKVAGILRPTGTPHDRAVFITAWSTWIVHAYERRIHPPEGIETAPFVQPTIDNLKPDEKPTTSLYVKARSPATIGELGTFIREELKLTPAFPTTEVRNLFRIVGSVDQVMLGLVLIVGIASALSILLAMYNSMDQRRRQIAVLRVLGCSRVRVFALTIAESKMIGLAGALLGVALGALGMWTVARVFESQTSVAIASTVDPATAGLCVLGAVAVAALAGLIPAVMAYRTSVVRGLRPLG